MFHKKKFYLLCFLGVIFCFCFYGITYAEEVRFECNTSPEAVQDLHSELVQKKNIELNSELSLWSSNKISLFSTISEASLRKGAMPSTGNVKALVLTVSFPNAPLTDEHFIQLTDDLIGNHSNADASKYYCHYDERSVKEIYRDMSNGKLNFDADIMPIYQAKYQQYYYAQNDPDLNDLITEILA